MSDKKHYLRKVSAEIEKVSNIEAASEKLRPRLMNDIESDSSPSVPGDWSQDAIRLRHQFLRKLNVNTDILLGNGVNDPEKHFNGNIENYIGVAQIPLGLAGPVRVNGADANGEFYIPLATTEGALVASYNRGIKACTVSGGITAVCLVEGIQRSPYFKFDSIATVGSFIRWLHDHLDVMVDIVRQSSRYAQLQDFRTNVEGNSVITTFEFTTGDAAGQNMVTICTDKICKYILQNFAVSPMEWYIESNYSGDKKATALSLSNVRGKKVTSEVHIPAAVVQDVLKSTPEAIGRYWKSSMLAVTQSGSIGVQGHVANGLTALFIACGQDAACVAESSVGITRMEVTSKGELYASLTLPSLIVGTVGGGTELPTQQQCLQLMDCAGEGKARKFAEICCAVCLAGEVSIAAAMAADHFTQSHQKLGRKNRGKESS